MQVACLSQEANKAGLAVCDMYQSLARSSIFRYTTNQALTAQYHGNIVGPPYQPCIEVVLMWYMFDLSLIVDLQELDLALSILQVRY